MISSKTTKVYFVECDACASRAPEAPTEREAIVEARSSGMEVKYLGPGETGPLYRCLCFQCREEYSPTESRDPI